MSEIILIKKSTFIIDEIIGAASPVENCLLAQRAKVFGASPTKNKGDLIHYDIKIVEAIKLILRYVEEFNVDTLTTNHVEFPCVMPI
jgi:hypothetical protein